MIAKKTMTAERLKLVAFAVALPLALAGCQSGGNTSRGSVAPSLTPAPEPQVAAVSGRWKPYSNGQPAYGYSEFKSGTYAAYPPDGKNTLAIGTYIATANGANITYYSAARKQDVKVACTLTSPAVMDCQTQDGTQVQLRKTQA
ncbi:hypothetical protein [Ahrensia sp. R2A130]|uniref:hypothetical protein n=1 Tax=Ahrensia sp. R2A130 TaxID=744979 RepID=UPI0012EA39EF|nr:hypothetical protein [Ahrensia sp. R2A130]